MACCYLPKADSPFTGDSLEALRGFDEVFVRGRLSKRPWG